MTSILRPILLAALAVIGSGVFITEPEVHPADPADNWSGHATDALLQQRAEGGRPYLPFMDHDALSMGVYVLSAGATDRQQPHDLDETYYVLDGRAILEVEGDSSTVERGDVIYVRANMAHRFKDIDEDLQLLVFFSKHRANDR